MTNAATILPTNRTGTEVALELAPGMRVEQMPVPVRDMDDPDRIVSDGVDFLAWGRSVRLWRDDWPEWKKRAAAKIAVYLRQRGGSLTALRGWISLLDAEIVDAVTPPAGCYATGGLTAEQRRAFLAQFAELRITLRRSPGPGDPGVGYASPRRPLFPNGYAGKQFARVGTARLRYGRKATIFDEGVSTEVLWSLAGIVEADNYTTPVERITIPSKARVTEPFVAKGFVGWKEHGFAEQLATTSKILTLGVDRVPQVNDRFSLYSGVSQIDVVSIVPERVSERAETAKKPQIVGHKIGGFAYINTAAERYYDRFHLFDPARVSSYQSSAYGTFVGISRVEITPFRADLRVNFPGGSPEKATRVNGFVGGFIQPPSGRLNKIADAVRAGKAARDKIFFTAQTKRKRTIADGIPINGTYRFGDLITIARGSL